jgi:hypothetical protein
VHSDFSSFASTTLTYLDGGAPFFKTLNSLNAGTYYYARVSAMNGQGYGDFTGSTPASLNPYQASSAPTGVLLKVTSDTMITVSFSEPESNGGDAIVKYRVEWDTAPKFNSLSALPHKGYVEVDAATYASYTINYLTKGQKYYTRVFAINSAGTGTPAESVPSYAAPALTVPGKPQSVVASIGSVVGTIDVVYQFPTVPSHGIQCSGTATNVFECPKQIGGGLPQSDGGSSIIEYEISYSERANFKDDYDTGLVTTSNLAYTLSSLTPGRTYYIRVLARNAVGVSSFCFHTGTNCNSDVIQVKAVAKAAV